MKVKNGMASSSSLESTREQLIGEIAEEIGGNQPELDRREAEEQAGQPPARTPLDSRSP